MQPDTSERDQLKKTLKRLVLLAAILLAISVCVQVALFAANLRTRRRGESLLVSLRKLHVGTSTLEDAQPILVTYNAEKIPPSSDCASGDAAFGILVSNDTINRFGERHPILLKAGVRPWGVTATLTFKGGRLCEFRYSPSALLLGSQYPLRISSLTNPRLIEIEGQTSVEAPESNENYQIRSFQNLLRGSRESGVHLGLRAVITPNATPSDFQRALTFDLSCFTSLRGCRTLCQIMPLLLQDAIQKDRAQGLPIPEVIEKEGEFPSCSEAYSANR